MKTDNKITLEAKLEYIFSMLAKEDPTITNVTVDFRIRKGFNPNPARVEIDITDTDENEIFDLFMLN